MCQCESLQGVCFGTGGNEAWKFNIPSFLKILVLLVKMLQLFSVTDKRMTRNEEKFEGEIRPPGSYKY